MQLLPIRHLFLKNALTGKSLVAVVSMLFFLGSCTSGNLKEPAEGNNDLTVVIVNGGGQQVTPRNPLGQPMKFQYTDGAGNPLASAKVSFKLIDVTDAPDKSIETISSAWEADSYSLAPDADPSNPKEDVTGRVLTSDSVTNANGEATVNVSATAYFGRTIAVVTKIEDEIFGSGTGYATYTTTDIEAGSVEIQLQSNGGLTESAKMPFNMSLRLKESGTKVQFDDTVPFEVSVEVPNSITSHNLPSGEIQCEFSGGLCFIPGSPFTVEGSGDIVIKLTSDRFAPIEEVLKIVGDRPVDVKISLEDPDLKLDTVCPNNPNKLDEENPCIIIPGGQDVFKFWPYLVDGNGSYISTTPGTWSVTGPLQGKLEWVNSEDAQHAYPEVAGKGEISVVTPTGFSATYSYYVQPRNPVSLLVETSNKGNEVAGFPFQITITGRDLNGETAVAFNETVELQFILKGDNPNWAGNKGTFPDGKMDCKFVEGICTVTPPSGMEGWLGINSEEPVLLSVSDTSGGIPDLWSTVINVTPDEPIGLVFADKAGGPNEDAAFIEDTDILMSTDHTYPMAVAVVDQFKNFVRDADAIWSGKTVDTTDALITTKGPETVIDPKKPIPEADSSYVEARAEGFSLLMPIVVQAGKPHTMSVDLPDTMQNGECYASGFQILDEDGNLSDGLDGLWNYNVHVNVDRPDLRESASVANGGNEVEITIESKGDAPRGIDTITSNTGDTADDVPAGATGLFSVSSSGSSNQWIYQGKGNQTFTFYYCAMAPGEVKISVTPNALKKAFFLLDPYSRALSSSYINLQPLEKTVNVTSSGPSYIAFKFTRGSKSDLVAIRRNLPQSKVPRENTDLAFWMFRRPDLYDILTASDDPLEIEPVLVDGGGYEIRPATGSWDHAWGDMVGMAPTSETSTKLITPGTRAIADSFGMYTIGFTDDATGIESSFQFRIFPAVPDEIVVARNGTNDADQYFGVRFTPRDKFGNIYHDWLVNGSNRRPVTYGIRTGSINVVHTGLPSPKGTPVEAPQFNEIPYFAGTDVGTFFDTDMVYYFPKALDPQSITFEFGQFSGYRSETFSLPNATLVFSPSVGEHVSRIVVSDDESTIIDPNPTIPADTDTKWRFKGVDQEGNYETLKAPALTVTHTGVISPNLQFSGHEGKVTIFASVTPLGGGSDIYLNAGTGTLKGTYEGENIDLETVTVVPGVPEWVDISFVTPPTPSDEVDAGTTYQLKVEIQDDNSNLIPTINGIYPLVWNYTGFLTNQEGKDIDLPTTTHCIFVDGVCTQGLTDTDDDGDLADETPEDFFFTPYSTKGSVNELLASLTYEGSNYSSKNFTLDVNHLPLDHYGIVAPDTYVPTKDRANSFDISVFPRDIHGNDIPASSVPAGTVVDVVLKFAGGGDASGTPDGTLTGIDMTSGHISTGEIVISGVAYDDHGFHKFVATDNNAITTPLEWSTSINMIANINQVTHYELLNFPAASPDINLTAGLFPPDNKGYVFDINPVNNYGRTVPADSQLNAMTFTLTGPGNSRLDGTPFYFKPPVFVNGLGRTELRVWRAETIPQANFKITDDTTSLEATVDGDVIVNPAAISYYTVVPDQTTVNADSTGLFNVDVGAFDAYANPRTGSSSLRLWGQRTGGYSLASNNYRGVFSGDSVPSVGTPMNFSMMSNTTVTFTNVWYGVGGTADLVLSPTGNLGTNGGVNVQTPTNMTFTTTIDTVNDYYVVADYTAPHYVGPIDVAVSARDQASNIIEGLDTELTAQKYCWSGPNDSPSPINLAPNFDNYSTFTNGVATFNMDFYRAEVLSSNLRVFDNKGGACFDRSSIPGGSKTGVSTQSLNIQPLAASQFTLTREGGGALVAGQGFNVRIEAVDTYGNLDSNFTSDNLSFSWAGASPSILGALPVEKNPNITGAVFTDGRYVTSGEQFKLYNTLDPFPTLTVDGGVSGLSADASFSLLYDVPAMIRIHTTNIVTNLGAVLDTLTRTTDDTINVYSHEYDQYGNYIGLTDTTWYFNGVLSGDETVLNPSNSATIEPSTIGTGTVRIEKSGFTDYTTGTITINQGQPYKLVFLTGVNNQTADDCGIMTIQAQDQDSNPTILSLTEQINLNSDGDGKFYSDNTCSSEITFTNITPGNSQVTVYFQDRTAEGPLTVSASDLGTDWIAANQSPTIDHGVPTQVVITSAAHDVPAQSCVKMDYEIQDAHGNPYDLPGNEIFDFSHDGASATFHAASGCASGAITQDTLLTGATGGSVWVYDDYANKPTISIDEQADKGWTVATQDVTFNLGAFTVTPVPSYDKISNPTINWTAALGATTYELTIDNDSGCPSPIAGHTYPGIVLTNQAISPPLPDGTYYACLKANGNGAPDEVASGSNFSFTIDTDTPTITLLGTPTDPDNVLALSITLDNQGIADIHEYKHQLLLGDVSCPNSPSDSGYPAWTTSSDPINDVIPTIQGNHTLCVLARDLADNQTSTATKFTWEYDTIAPTAVINNAPTGVSKDTTMNITINGDQVVEYQYKFSNSNVCTTAGGFTGPDPQAQLIDNDISGLSEGSVYLCVIGKDLAGNWQAETSATAVNWTKDTTPPSVNVGGARFVNSSVAIDATATDTNTITTYLWERTVGSGTVTFSSPNTEDTNITFADDNTYTIQLSVTDVAGNIGTDTFSLTWDTAEPTPTLNGEPGFEDNSTALNIDVQTFSNEEVWEYQYELTQPASADCSAPTYGSWTSGSEAIDDVLGIDETKRLCILTRDRSGNVASAPLTHFWIKDTVAPTATISGEPSNPSNDANIDIDVAGAGVTIYRYKIVETVSDPCSVTSGYSVDKLESVNIQHAHSEFTDGTLWLCVISRDAAGNWQAYADATKHSWTKDTNPPNATLSSSPPAYSSTNAATAIVGGTDVSHYMYKVESGVADCSNATGYSSEIAIGTPNINHDISGFAQGTVTICVVGRDIAGNWEAYSDANSVSWVRDTLAPTAAYSGQPSAEDNSTSVNITVSTFSPIETHQFKFDILGPGAPTDCSSASYGSLISGSDPLTEALGLDGTYRLCLLGQDQAGNLQSTATTYAWIKDTAAPTAVITGAPTGLNNEASITVDVGNDNGLTHYKYKLDTSDTCSSASGYSGSEIAEGTDISQSISGMADGPIWLCVIGRDVAGNWKSEANATKANWTKDTEAPNATLSSSPPAYSNTDSATATLGGTDVSHYRYKVESGVADCSNATGYVSEIAIGTPNISHDISGFGQGTVTICVIGRDAQGNWEAFGDADSVSWTRDTLAPTAGYSGQPSTEDSATSVNLTVSTFSATETHQFKFDILGPGAPADCSTASYGSLIIGSDPLTESLGADGTYRLCLLGQDQAGNVQSTATTYAWTKDTAAPTAVFTGHPTGTNNDTSITVDVGSNNGLTHYKFKLATSDTCSSASGYSGSEIAEGTDISQSISGMADGPIWLCVIGRDLAGNWETEANATKATWTKDTDAPDATLSSAPTGYSNTDSATATVGGTDVSHYRYKVESGVADCSSGTGYVSEIAIGTPNINHDISGFGQGIVTICVIGRDAQGNWEAFADAASVSWTRDTLAPTATYSGQPSAQDSATSVSMTVSTFSATETHQFKFDILGPGAPADCSSASYGALINGDDPLSEALGADGTYRLCLLGQDQAGNVQSTATTYAWTKDTAAPTAVFTGHPTGTTADTSITVDVGNNNGLTHYKFKLDTTDTCSSATGYSGSEIAEGTDISQSISGMSDGPIWLCVIGRDLAGNWETEANATKANWTKDTTGPSKPAGLKIPADNTGDPHANYDNDLDVYFVWSTASDSGIGGVEYKVTYYTNGTCSLTGTDSSWQAGTNLSHSGSNGQTLSFIVQARDSLGNLSTPSDCSSSIQLDNAAPSAFSITGPATTSTTQSPTITWADPGDADNYDIKIVASNDCNATAVDSANVGTNSGSVTLSEDGTFYACVTAKDNAGNTTDASNQPYAFEVETSVVHLVTTVLSSGQYGLAHWKLENGSWSTTNVVSLN